MYLQSRLPNLLRSKYDEHSLHEIMPAMPTAQQEQKAEKSDELEIKICNTRENPQKKAKENQTKLKIIHASVSICNNSNITFKYLIN